MQDVIIDDKNRVVRYPELHDSRVIGVSFEQNIVTIRFQTAGMGVIRLFLQNVKGLSIDSVFEQNIVFEVQIVRATEMDSSAFARVFHQQEGLTPRRLLRKDEEANFVFVLVTPTLGADMLAFCEKVYWENE